MELDEVIATLENEVKCVQRNEAGKCDRHCEDCDLVLPTEQVLDAYAVAIVKLKKLNRG